MWPRKSEMQLWMSPFSVAVAQGIAGIPVLSGATFRIIMWVVITGLSAAYLMVYAERIRKNPGEIIDLQIGCLFPRPYPEDI